jgi:hypothetical protein
LSLPLLFLPTWMILKNLNPPKPISLYTSVSIPKVDVALF